MAHRGNGLGASAELALRARHAVEEQHVLRPVIDPVRLPVIGVLRQPRLAASTHFGIGATAGSAIG